VTVPGVLLVTQTSTRHRAPAAMVPLVKEMVSVPVTAVSDAEGPHPEDTLGPCELLIVTPAGRISVNEKLVSEVSAGARRSTRNLEFPPASMVLGLKDFPPVIPVPTA
jgi:hypothetical protein